MSGHSNRITSLVHLARRKKNRARQ
jgi:hypothetical protein